MRVLFAPDSFTGTLTAAAAAEAMAAGWRAARPHDELDCLAMSDGGEGTLAVVEAALAGCRRVTTEVANARGYATDAEWLLLSDGTALIESAQACGLTRLTPELRNPRLATTYGVGQLLEAAVEAGAGTIIVGLGGSATVDGGAGMATAMGHRLLRQDGNGVKVGAEYLADLHEIKAVAPPAAAVVAAADVTAPLLGQEGAVAGFAAQKGAGPDDMGVLEAALSRLADIVERDVAGGPWRNRPGSGAAGGLGFGLAAFAGAQVQAGAELIGSLVGLEERISRAAVVVTGEGRMDGWTVRGKAPGHVAALARAHNAEVYAVTGLLADAAELAEAFAGITELGEAGRTDAAAAVAAATEKLAGAIG